MDASSANTEAPATEDGIAAVLVMMEDYLAERLDVQHLLAGAPGFLYPEEDADILRGLRTSGVRMVLTKAIERNGCQELLTILEPEYPVLVRCLREKDMTALCKNSSATSQDEDAMKLEILRLLRGSIYHQVDPREILPILVSGGFLSTLECEKIYEIHHRFDACVELVRVLVCKKKKGSYYCLMKALWNCHQQDVVKDIDPDFEEKMARREAVTNNLAPVERQIPGRSLNGLNVGNKEDTSLSAVAPGRSEQTSSASLSQVGNAGFGVSAAENKQALSSRTSIDASAANTVNNSSGVAAAGTSEEQLQLRPYQREVARPALRGLNCIICMPTNSGKTIVATHIIEQHLLRNMSGKAAFMAPKVALVNQQYEVFQKYLGRRFKILCITGEASESVQLHLLLQSYHILVFTPQIILNSIEGHCESTDNNLNDQVDILHKFSLIILDECHNCIKESPYSKLMSYYLRDKLADQCPLPQVLGLTATLGVGSAKSDEQAEKHMLKLCASLDSAVQPVQVEEEIRSLEEHVSIPRKERHAVDDRPQDEFSHVIIKSLKCIEDIIAGASAELMVAGLIDRPPDPMTQAYQHWAVESQRKFKETMSDSSINQQVIDIGFDHLQKYWEALDIWKCARHKDAYKHLDKHITFTNTAAAREIEDILRETKKSLQPLLQVEDNNPLLKKLAEIIRRSFAPSTTAAAADQLTRGLIFVRTRELTLAICEWLEALDGGALKALKPLPLTGAHASTDRGGKTLSEQNSLLQAFRDGDTRLLVCTSVAEEGIDIPECNFSIGYLRTVNEVSAIQARGRVRKEHGTAHTISSKDREKKDELNIVREDMMYRAMRSIGNMQPSDFAARVAAYQKDAVRVKAITQSLAQSPKSKLADTFSFECGRCSTLAVSGSYVRVYANAHHIVTDPSFDERIVIHRHPKPAKIGRDMHKDRKIGCKECKHDWGIGMIMKGCDFYVIKIESFKVRAGDSCRVYSKWKDLPFELQNVNEDELVALGNSKVNNI